MSSPISGMNTPIESPIRELFHRFPLRTHTHHHATPKSHRSPAETRLTNTIPKSRIGSLRPRAKLHHRAILCTGERIPELILHRPLRPRMIPFLTHHHRRILREAHLIQVNHPRESDRKLRICKTCNNREKNSSWSANLNKFSPFSRQEAMENRKQKGKKGSPFPIQPLAPILKGQNAPRA
jgi:hypothetical protein